MIKQVSGTLQFRLNGPSSTYAFLINSLGKPITDYFGPLLDDGVPLESFAKRLPFVPGTSVVYDEDSDASFSLDAAPSEFSLLGKGDYSSPSIILKSPSRGYMFDFRYEGHRMQDGALMLDGLPTPHGIASTLVVSFKEAASDLFLELVYGLHEATGTLIRTARLINKTAETLEIERFASFQSDFFLENPELISLVGGWAAEANCSREKLAVGKKVISSHMGVSGNRANPFFMVVDDKTGLFDGPVISCNLVYSASHFHSLELTPKGKLRVASGIDDEGFRFCLAPGEAFEAPYATLSYAEGGLNGAMACNHLFVKDAILPERFKNRERKVLLNNWEGTYFNFNEAKIVSLAKDAKKLGVELFVLDDGWFKGRNSDTTSLGDYQSDKKKLPGGIERLAKKIVGLGLEFGLWVEPEAVSEDSDLYRSHPEYAISAPGLKPSRGRHELLLDLSKDEVVDHILDELTSLLSSSPISYIKWDMNRPFSDYPPDGAFLYRYAKGLYRLMESISERFPNVFFQGCASGGNRFDLGILSFFPEIWASDNTDPIARLVIQSGLALGYPLSCMGSHVAASPSHQTLRKTPLSTRFDCAAFGGFGYELSSKELTPVERKEVASQIDFYKEHRTLFQKGNFVLLKAPSESDEVVWELIDDARERAVIASFLVKEENIVPPSFLRGANFKETALYKVVSRPLDIDIATFGGLINQVLPFHLNPEGPIVSFLRKRKGIPSDRESIVVSGSLLNQGRVALHEDWSGTGLSDQVKVRGEGGSRLYYIEEIK